MILATTKMCLEKRWAKNDGTNAVTLRVTYNREQKYYVTGIYITIDDWEKIQQPNPRKENKEFKTLFNKIEERAIAIIRELNPFSFGEFERKFNQKATSRKDVFGLFELYIEKLKLENRLTTADSYSSTLKSFSKFTTKTKLALSEITVTWLTNYEIWMLNKGSSTTTIGIYLRNLRSIINQAIDDGNFNKDAYPFGKRKYQIPASQNIKKAINKSEIQSIFNYKTDNKAEEKARDLWVFSYMCNGANIKDIAKLQYKNISKTNLVFIRSKTERSTKSNLKLISIPLMPEISALIAKWGVKPIETDEYIFGIISSNDNPEKQLANIKQATKTINKYMSRIGLKLGIELKLTTYSARHSFATMMKRSGAAIELISESLGHKDSKTTEKYLDSFEDEAKLVFHRKLVDFDS